MFKVNDRWFESYEEAKNYQTDLENHHGFDEDIEVEELTSGRPPGHKNLVWGCKGKYEDGSMRQFTVCQMWDTEEDKGIYFKLPGVRTASEAEIVLDKRV